MNRRLNRIVFLVIGLGAVAQVLIAFGGVAADPDVGGVVAVTVSALVAVTMAVLLAIDFRRARRVNPPPGRPQR
ncbi:hypothetical protein HQQ80_05485 [Microbacteriaceae bacterium VKM Ac-2855]|nr:hypothetical protein [Microbacteriaceae bacterium VKM Ac-2855]